MAQMTMTESVNAYGTRADCTRDNKQTICPNSSGLGFSTNVAKRGNWIVYEQDNHKHTARIVGRVTCEGRTYIEVIAMTQAMTAAYVRWIDPLDVREIYPTPHYEVIHFMLGEWTDADTILRGAHRGHLCQAWFDARDKRHAERHAREDRRLAKG